MSEVMLHGVLNMPIDLWRDDELDKVQRHSRYVEASEIIRQQQATIETLKTTMMAAAVEIQEHWDAHCDADGYGPVNLIRRLENGVAAEYGYDAKTVVNMKAALEVKHKLLRLIVSTLESLIMSAMFESNDDTSATIAMWRLREAKQLLIDNSLLQVPGE